MKNIIVLGSGRSGTSMLTGLFAKSGYFMGGNLYPGRDTNPKGFFESGQINSINEDIIREVAPKRLRLGPIDPFSNRPNRPGQRWLTQLDLNTKLPDSDQYSDRITSLVSQQPFCFKDPRFCYTLPVWKPYLNNTIFLVVFRHPHSTANSMVKEYKAMPYLRGFKFTKQDALNVWHLMYSHILNRHIHDGGNWLFMHYEQILSGECYNVIEEFAEVKVDRGFVDQKLNRNVSREKLEVSLKVVYDSLCEKSKYTELVV
ncbi:sulfotransferase [Tunicatimonas pelagia]|uniref:sulfotransferase n=1 Tax=Tunicatimonas pelagia TaxID=931531 RepID=UPI002666CA13|nr:sulfotransferase [Tunicatimonas pelagia]WKN44450.1 sulfotransferase [Tunicatimonas pelagia]